MSLNQTRLTMQMIKKYWIYLLLLVSIIFFIYKKFIITSNTLQVKTFPLPQGWGYDVYKNNKIFIHQEMIPAIEGTKTFVSKEEAERVGELVLTKMKLGKGGGLPQVKVAELDSLKITR